MATYQASVGMHTYYGKKSGATWTWTEIPGLTKTPKKGGTPETVSLSIISEKFKRSLAGQQSMETFTYEFAPDFTPTTGNLAVIKGMVAAGSEVWIYEEYTTGDTTLGVYTPGAGILFKGKPSSVSVGEQTGSSAQSGEFSLDLTSDSIYVGDYTSGEAIDAKDYYDIMTGAAATPLA